MTYTYKYKQMRQAILKRDDHTCQYCGQPGDQIDHIIPATTVNQTVSAARKTLTGLIQFNIYTKEGVGTKKSEELAQALLDLFPVVPKTGTVSIEQTGSIMNTLYEAQWLVTPVRFRYRQENY